MTPSITIISSPDTSARRTLPTVKDAKDTVIGQTLSKIRILSQIVYTLPAVLSEEEVDVQV